MRRGELVAGVGAVLFLALLAGAAHAGGDRGAGVLAAAVGPAAGADGADEVLELQPVPLVGDGPRVAGAAARRALAAELLADLLVRGALVLEAPAKDRLVLHDHAAVHAA